MAKQYEYYQEGNTVRTRVMEIPNPEEELLKLPPEEKHISRAARKRTAPLINPAKIGVFMLLTVLTVLLAAGGLMYLKLHASITASRRNIYKLEKELSEKRTANELTASRMDADLNLAEVYQIATVQLGMVHADGSETIRYEEQVREYVRQYENIPGN
ncbi:MAG: hypothetical protein IJR95_09975 [Lachnospiraceae bacterium]|nr:hypothetical protein [Lachnospiraceae bacterium]